MVLIYPQHNYLKGGCPGCEISNPFLNELYDLRGLMAFGDIV